MIFLCLCPGWSPSDVKLYEYCDILMFVCRMVSVMSNCMNIVIFLCLCPGWSLCDVKLDEYCDILMLVCRMVSVMSNCMNIVIFLCLCPEWSLCDVKLYEYCDILMFVSRMVSLWCQTVWLLWYSYVSVQDDLPVMSNCMNIVIFLCMYP